MNTQSQDDITCLRFNESKQVVCSNSSFIDEPHQHDASDFIVQLMHSPMEITIKIIGKIYLEQQPLLNEALFSALKQKTAVRIDLSELAYFDLENIQLIFAAQKEAQRENIQFSVAPLSSYAKHTIRLSGLLYELYSK